jgi:Carboxypeptidase regulatory-like domain
MQNNTHVSHKRRLAMLLNRAHTLALIILSGVILIVPMSAQSFESATTRTGKIIGTVVDSTDDPLAGATVVLQTPNGESQKASSKDDGSFAFQEVAPGIAHEVTITAEGFADWKSSVEVEPGQEKTLTDIKLRILAVQRAVTVSYSSKEVAAEQVKAEEQQRILRFIPNLYVVYEPHPEPLTTKMKFHMAYKDLSSPVFFARVGAWAAVQQANNTPHYGQGAEGYGKRLGAGFADSMTENLFGNAILPSLLHQDPRYFYQGTGTKWSRALHAVSAPFTCKGDNGKLQPNYSTWGGSLISSSISTLYYPDGNRGPAHVFGTFGIGMALHVGSSLAQEFIFDKFTSRGRH